MAVADALAWNHVTSSRTCVAPVDARLASERWHAAVPYASPLCSPPPNDSPRSHDD